MYLTLPYFQGNCSPLVNATKASIGLQKISGLEFKAYFEAYGFKQRVLFQAITGLSLPRIVSPNGLIICCNAGSVLFSTATRLTPLNSALKTDNGSSKGLRSD